MLRPVCLGFLAAFWAVTVTAAGVTAPDASLIDDHWQRHDPRSDRTVDHGVWQGLLKRYIVADEALSLNRFDYAAVTRDDKVALDTYLDRLQSVTVTRLSRAEQKAYWINLYNAFTVDIVLDRYPVDSIRDIGGGLFSRGPWSDDDFTVSVEGRALTLDDIEHGILRPLYRDPLIHYGVNCASVGCPNLVRRAYTGATVDEMLARNARAFVNSPRGIQAVDGTGVTVSSIYVWFKADFGGTDAGVLRHVRRFADDARSRALDGATRLRGHDYDWSLNDAQRPAVKE